MIFGGNANPRLTQNIAAYLQQPIGKLQLTRFSDGETAVEILENVRGGDIFIIQPVYGVLVCPRQVQHGAAQKVVVFYQ